MNDNQLGLLDILNILSFCIGLMNLEENLTQGDKQELQEDLANKAELLLKEIHKHLESQDTKLDIILKTLEEINNDNSRNILKDK